METVGASRRFFACAHKGGAQRPKVRRSRAGAGACWGNCTRNHVFKGSRNGMQIVLNLVYLTETNRHGGQGAGDQDHSRT